MGGSGHDVVGLGQCSLDTLIAVSSYPACDSKREFSEQVIQGGGPVATALVALARWGARCTFRGVVGDDDTGRSIRESLQGEGIDLQGLVTRVGVASQVAFIVVEAPTGRRTVFWRRPTGAPLRADEIDEASIERARVLYTDGLFAEAALAASHVARRAGTKVVVDAGTLREGMLDVCRQSDVFLVSESFARSLVGDDDPHGACRRLAELGPELVGVTLGERGYVALCAGRTIEAPAYAVDAADTTGCGDVFHAGVAHGLLQGWDAERCLDFGAWTASHVATRMGGRAGIPDARDYRGR